MLSKGISGRLFQSGIDSCWEVRKNNDIYLMTSLDFMNTHTTQVTNRANQVYGIKDL